MIHFKNNRDFKKKSQALCEAFGYDFLFTGASRTPSPPEKFWIYSVLCGEYKIFGGIKGTDRVTLPAASSYSHGQISHLENGKVFNTPLIHDYYILGLNPTSNSRYVAHTYCNMKGYKRAKSYSITRHDKKSGLIAVMNEQGFINEISSGEDIKVFQSIKCLSYLW